MNLLDLGLFTPLVFFAHLRFFLGRKVILDVKRGPNVFGCFTLDHGGDRGAGQIQQRLDIQVIRRQDEFKQQYLFDIDKICVPFLDDFRHVLRLERLFNLRHGLGQVVLAKFQNFLENLRLDVG